MGAASTSEFSGKICITLHGETLDRPYDSYHSFTDLMVVHSAIGSRC